MLRRLFALATLASVVIGLASAGQASAAVGPRTSDNNLRWARHRLEANIDLLQRDNHDYGGYRVRAIGTMQAARGQLVQAVAYDHGADQGNAAALMRAGVPIDNRSDRQLLVVRRNVERIIDVLQRDNHDYGGHRVIAIGLLQQARRDLISALRYDNRAGRGSDQNLRWARSSLEANIDQLQRDQHDYHGYRVLAIKKMQAAREQLVQALAYDRSADQRNAAMMLRTSGMPIDNRSDRNLLVVRRHVERIIDVLARDNHDYGGHRVAAIGLLRQARQDIVIALRYDNIH